jgi:hypothetical protein
MWGEGVAVPIQVKWQFFTSSSKKIYFCDFISYSSSLETPVHRTRAEEAYS